MQIDTEKSPHVTVRLDALDGRSFNLLDLDVVAWEPRSLPNQLDEIASVTSSEGGYRQVTSAGLLSFTGQQWRNVSWIELDVLDPDLDGGQDSLRFDNIRLTPARVPEPMTLLLVGLGLGGLAVARKLQRASRRSFSKEPGQDRSSSPRRLPQPPRSG